jgi:hypothetical protein
MADTSNMYVERSGRIFISIVDPDLYEKVKNKYSDIIKVYHPEQFIKKTKPAKLDTIVIEGSESYGNIIIKVKKDGSFNLSEIFHYKGSIFQNPYPVTEKTTVDKSLEQYRKHIIDSGIVNKIEMVRGYSLGCFCLPGQPCHSKVLVGLLDDSEKTK